MKKLPYAEGSVFLVPLRNGWFARGVVARAGPNGKVLFGYFFGPQLETRSAATASDLKPEDAILRVQFGDLGLMNGEWPVIGQIPAWDRSSWSMPSFIRSATSTGTSVMVTYSDTDPSKPVLERPVQNDTGLLTDRLCGYGSVEIQLTELLSRR